MTEPIEVPTHVLVRRIRQELEDNMAALSLAIGMGEYNQAQDFADRVKTLVGILEALLAEGEGIYT